MIYVIRVVVKSDGKIKFLKAFNYDISDPDPQRFNVINRSKARAEGILFLIVNKF